MSDTVLETVGLSMSFGGVKALDNVDFRLGRGELRCLIGPNGAGKSTFFKCLTGLLKPTFGEIFLRGENITSWESCHIVRKGVGIKTQTPNVMDGLSVYENIWLAARGLSARVLSNRIDEIVEDMTLGSILKSRVGELSHGERQRVELGMVLVGSPGLILLDEPAAGMTGEEIEVLKHLILKVGERASIIIVEHDMQFIRSIAKTVTVFFQGSIFIEDEVDVVMSDSRVRDIYLGRGVLK